jgi:isoquinoline 1-oxidoreductase beta subunit
MTKLANVLSRNETPLAAAPANLSRRRFMQLSAGTATGAFVLGFGLPFGTAHAAGASEAMKPGTRVPAFLEIRPDNSVRLQSPFVEGGQGVFTAMAQIVGEELDADPAVFIVENAPAGADYQVMDNGRRLTGGSQSVRTSYDRMRRLGALARRMMLQAASQDLGVPLGRARRFGPFAHLWATRRTGHGSAGARSGQRDAQGSQPVSLDRQAGRPP